MPFFLFQRFKFWTKIRLQRTQEFISRLNFHTRPYLYPFKTNRYLRVSKAGRLAIKFQSQEISGKSFGIWKMHQRRSIIISSRIVQVSTSRLHPVLALLLRYSHRWSISDHRAYFPVARLLWVDAIPFTVAIYLKLLDQCKNLEYKFFMNGILTK